MHRGRSLPEEREVCSSAENQGSQDAGEGEASSGMTTLQLSTENEEESQNEETEEANSPVDLKVGNLDIESVTSSDWADHGLFIYSKS